MGAAFVVKDGVASGSLPHGLEIGGKQSKAFELREYTVEDLLDAETEASVTQPLTFNAQLMIRQLVRVGDFKGPFTLNMIKRLKPADWRVLRAAQTEL